MKPKSMVVVKQENSPGARSSVLVNNMNNAAQRSVIANGAELMRCKRKAAYVSGQSYPPAQPASVARRNARERNRVKQVNNGFATLRSHIPPDVAAALSTEKPSSRSSSANKKLSKVETLKMAVEYIRSLQQLLDEHNGALDKQSDSYEIDESYYSSSPETIVSGENQYYPNSPEVFQKSDQSEFYSAGRTFVKSEPFPHFNPEIHETLTSEFYHTRSPVKVYSSPERDTPDDGLTPLATLPQSLTFMAPRIHQRGSTSLSPPMSDACPSPTPSYSSDHSSVHPGSVVSSSSGHLASQLSRLTTTAPHITESRRSSPEGYDSSEAMSPKDEELLDIISWWQSN